MIFFCLSNRVFEHTGLTMAPDLFYGLYAAGLINGQS